VLGQGQAQGFPRKSRISADLERHGWKELFAEERSVSKGSRDLFDPASDLKRAIVVVRWVWSFNHTRYAVLTTKRGHKDKMFA